MGLSPRHVAAFRAAMAVAPLLPVVLASRALLALVCRLPNYSRGIRQKLHRLCNESNWKVPAPAGPRALQDLTSFDCTCMVQ